MKKLLMAIAVCTAMLTGGTAFASAKQTADHNQISQVILKWGHYRDHGMWDKLATTFRPGGKMHVSWYVGDIEGFIDKSKIMAQSGTFVSHVMYPSIIEVQENRALALSPASILARNEDMSVDLNSAVQFVDLLEKVDGSWRIVRRQCIYKLDRMDSILPSLKFWLMSFFIDTDAYDPSFRHLAFVLEKNGFPVLPRQVTDNSPSWHQLLKDGQTWLETGALID